MRLTAISLIIAGIIVVMPSAPMEAHHSIPAFYEADKTISLTGVLKEVKIANPHCLFRLEVTDREGRKVTWAIIAGTAQSLATAGWTNETLKVGSTITVEGHPSRAKGTTGLVGVAFITPEGKRLSPGKID
jgi:hypothetical protein